MNRTWIALVLGAALLAAGLLLFSLEETPEPTSLRQPQRDVTVPVLERAEPLAGSSTTRREAAAERDAQQEPEGPVLRGTLGIEGEGGVLTPVDAGRITFAAGVEDDEAGWAVTTVPVAGGRWTLPTAPHHRVEIRGIEAGGRTAILTLEQRAEQFPADRTLDLRAVLLGPVRLRVIDADSKADLRDVQVIRSMSRRQDEHQIPCSYGPQGQVFEAAASPLEVPAGRVTDFTASGVYFVRSPGYAWRKIELDHRTPGERVIELPRSGSVEIQIRGGPANSKTMLHMHGWDGSAVPAAEFALAGTQRITIDGLPPREFSLTAVIGPWYGPNEVLGRASFTIEPGVRTAVTLDLEAPEPPPLSVPFEGVIVVPTAWELQELSIVLLFMDRLRIQMEKYRPLKGKDVIERVPGKPSEWHFDAGAVQAGRYELRFDDLGVRERFDVPERGTRRARIVLSAPARISLQVEVKGPGKDIALDSVTWWWNHPENLGGARRFRVKRDPETGRFEFSVPQGHITVSADNDAHNGKEFQVQVGPGVNRAVMEVLLSGSAAFVFKDGAARVPVSQWIMLTEINGKGIGRTALPMDDGMHVWVDNPGRYSMDMEPIDGFEPVPEREVLIEAGKITRVEVQLVRKR